MAFKPIQIVINAKDNASAVFSSLQAKVAAVGAAIATYFGISAFAGVVKGAADFEQAMSRVQAATGATGKEMAALTKAAEDAGANTKFTSTEAAGALENLAKAGLNAGEAIETLPAVLNLAQAGDIGLAESSELVTKAVMGMGLAFTEAGRVADVLALGANATNTSVLGLAQALSYAAPVAQSLGLSLESTVAIIGKFADAGIDASRAGTALNSILSQFSNPASKFREELTAIGITTGDFEKALHQLAAAGPVGSKAILSVGQEAGPALRALLNQGMPALDELKRKLDDAAGSAAATAKVMQNNLNGSLSGLASAWDTVKNALGTPVLPVLKEGVDQLAAAFRNAVADGTVTRFGESIATAFKNGIQFVRDFVSTVDFTAVLARMQEFANSANETLTKVGEYATNAGNTVKLAYGVMSAGVNGVLTAIYGIGSVFAEVASKVMEGVALLREGLASITFGELSASFKLAAEDARSAAEGFGDAAQAMRDKATQALQDTADAAQTARNGFDGLRGATDETTKSTDLWALAVANAAAEIERAGKAQAEANSQAQAAKKASDEQAAALRLATESMAKLREEYAAAVKDGNWQKAAELQEKLNAALRDMKGAGKEAADTVAQVDAAFGRLGVVSAAKLNELAKASQADFETIRSSGLATAEDLSRAFKKAAEDAIAANKGIAPGWVTAEAAARGYRIVVDEAGRATLELVNKGAEGLERMARGWHMNREAIEAQKDAMAEMLMRYTMTADLTERQIRLLEREAAAAKKAAEAYREKWNMDKEGYALNTKGERALQGESQETIDADIARRYGKENVGNPLAEEARQLAKILSDMAQIGGLSRIESAESSKQIAEQRRRLQELEALLLNGIGAATEGDGQGGGGRPQAPGAGGGRGGSSSGGGASSGTGSGGGGGISPGISGPPQPAPQFNFVINANGINDPVKLAKLLEPELQRIAALKR